VARWAAGRIIRSSVVTRYQQGLARQVGWLTSPPRASTREDGLPPIMVPISVNGNGATIDGTGAVRVQEVDGPGGNLSAQNLTITGGAADVGGGIENVGGTVTLNHSRVTGNTATQASGGIASATFDPSSVAKLTLNNSAVTGNSQTDPPPNSLGGGGIVNVLGTVTLNSSQVNNNSVRAPGPRAPGSARPRSGLPCRSAPRCFDGARSPSPPCPGFRLMDDQVGGTPGQAPARTIHQVQRHAGPCGQAARSRPARWLSMTK